MPSACNAGQASLGDAPGCIRRWNPQHCTKPPLSSGIPLRVLIPFFAMQR